MPAPTRHPTTYQRGTVQYWLGMVIANLFVVAAAMVLIAKPSLVFTIAGPLALVGALCSWLAAQVERRRRIALGAPSRRGS
jgi:hypothetical protein